MILEYRDPSAIQEFLQLLCMQNLPCTVQSIFFCFCVVKLQTCTSISHKVLTLLNLNYRAIMTKNQRFIIGIILAFLPKDASCLRSGS